MNIQLTFDPTSRFMFNGTQQTQIKLITTHRECIAQIEAAQTDTELFQHIKRSPSQFQIPPVGIIGPKDATNMQYEMAQTLGEHLAHLGLTILCGGRSGVMEAACKGAFMAGGTSIGMLPGDKWTEANPYVTIPIVTNMGPTRNSLIAKTAFALVAIGGGYGTLTEIAYGLHYDKPVFATLDAPAVAGCTYLDDLDLIVTQVIGRLLGTTKL